MATSKIEKADHDEFSDQLSFVSTQVSMGYSSTNASTNCAMRIPTTSEITPASKIPKSNMVSG